MLPQVVIVHVPYSRESTSGEHVIVTPLSEYLEQVVCQTAWATPVPIAAKQRRTVVPVRKCRRRLNQLRDCYELH